MGFKDKNIQTDKSNFTPIPQYFNPVSGEYEAQEGQYGASAYLQRGTIAQEAFSGSTDTTQTFPSNRYGFSIINDGNSDLTFTIGGQTRTVKVGESYQALFDAFTSVSIVTNGTAYRAEVLK